MDPLLINTTAIKQIELCEWNNGIFYVDDLYLGNNTTDAAPAFTVPNSVWFQNVESGTGFAPGVNATTTR